MAFHGGFQPPAVTPPDAEVADGDPRRSFRNLFGALRPGEDDGWRMKEDYDLLHRLARRMSRPYDWGEGQSALNPNLPAGYTYLAQFVAHDLSFLGSTVPSVHDSLLNQRNLRTIALNLDTVYGGGPLDKPSAYCIPDTLGAPRYRLRLGLLRNSEGEFPTSEAEKRLHARDLPRVACPFMNGPGRDGLTDVLIPDPRNDDHPILAQMLVLFHLLHNAVCERLESRRPPPKPREIFADARRVVTHVYHGIVRNDLMQRMLSPEIFAAYSRPGRALLDPGNDGCVPAEFSHAAYRLGHAMVQAGYQFGEVMAFGLVDILKENSIWRPDGMPLDGSWLIRWSNFFEIEGRDRPRNLSRRIAPAFNRQLYKEELFKDETARGQRRDEADNGGLPFRDLLRGASIEMRSVSSLIAKVGEQRPELLAGASLLTDAAFRRRAIMRWLSTDAGIRFSDAEKQRLSENPPLFFFLLFEAARPVGEGGGDGLRLGRLASIIVAEVVFRALDNAADPAPPGRATPSDLAREAFDGPAPASMPSLIRFLAERYGLAGEEAAFI